tara:strand:- start:699 stop:2480 length:1782 start_codon:yes stop_codon:yes gene_type:complete
MLYFRWFIFLGLLVLSTIGILPTVEYYSNYYQNPILQESHPEKTTELKNKSLTLGLDLQGGIHMVLELDLVDLYKNLMNDEYQNDFKELKFFENVLIDNSKSSTSASFIDNLFDNYDNESLINYYSDFIPENIPIGSESDFLKQALKDKLLIKLSSSTEIIRNRIDAIGVTEPLIQTKGNNQIIVEIAGIQDTSRAESLIKNTGTLEFIVVKDHFDSWTKKINQIDNNSNLSQYLYFHDGISMKNFNEFNISLSRSVIPYALVRNDEKVFVDLILKDTKNQELLIDSQFLWALAGDQIPGYTQLYFLNKYVELSGNEIKNPIAQQFPFEDINSGQWYISLEFINPMDFEEITDDNKGKFLAIILDGEIQMAPRINQKISGGKAQITGNFTKSEAKDMEAILVAGELPAKINIASKLQVDASLGSDSIVNGFNSILIALSLVLIFMILYYKGFGLLANFAMILNLLFILAFLSNPWINATLSLPGIAGIILTVGMAIDANVIIFERIREEMLKQKTIMDIIDIGYKKAFQTILDSNLTTLISATSLYLFGSGPIKGFAVTLSLGIICSMFTAIFVTRTILITFLSFRKIKELSI